MKLAAYLESTGVKPSAFARRIGCPPSTITRILRDERSPGIGLMSRIREATDGQVSFEDFMEAPRVAPSSEAAA